MRPGVTSNAPIILLPGLAADGRLFDPQRRAFPNLQTPEWIDPLPDETLREYARRWAERLRTDHAPMYLGGVSFGGMVAQEWATRLPVKAVFLIATCRSGAEIPRSLRFAARSGRHVPNVSLRCAQRMPRAFHQLFLGVPPEMAAVLRDMFASTSIGFLKWGLQALADWPGAERPPAPVYQIHGGSDRLIPAHRTHPDRIVTGAGHLMNMTHAGEVNAFLCGLVRE